jgi:hypothetical protein
MWLRRAHNNEVPATPARAGRAICDVAGKTEPRADWRRRDLVADVTWRDVGTRVLGVWQLCCSESRQEEYHNYLGMLKQIRGRLKSFAT